jgi:hypothetical protein
MRAIMTVLLMTILGSAAVAQSLDDQKPPQPPSTNGMASEPAAPVGHRQPTQSSLTPRVRQEENAGRGTPDPLGPLPQICRNC